jgi:hypothetical protein
MLMAVDSVDLEQAREWDKSFPNQWNSVIEKNTIWFYNGSYNRIKINCR